MRRLNRSVGPASEIANGSSPTISRAHHTAWPSPSGSCWRVKLSTDERGARYAGGLKRGTDGAVGTPNHTDSYWVVDAMASYRVNKNLDIQLNVFNLFDKDYVAAINKSGYRYHPGEPRTFLLTANVHF